MRHSDVTIDEADGMVSPLLNATMEALASTDAELAQEYLLFSRAWDGVGILA